MFMSLFIGHILYSMKLFLRKDSIEITTEAMKLKLSQPSVHVNIQGHVQYLY